MDRSPALILTLAALVLAACVSAAPSPISDDHPASPQGASGFVASPIAIEEYKTPQDFTARAAEEAAAPAAAHMNHGGMSMPGTQAPQAPPKSAPVDPGAPHDDHAH